MDGYRYSVERHKLLIALEGDKERIAEQPDRAAEAHLIATERAFREQLDALYGQVRGEFEDRPPARSPAAH